MVSLLIERGSDPTARVSGQRSGNVTILEWAKARGERELQYKPVAERLDRAAQFRQVEPQKLRFLGAKFASHVFGTPLFHVLSEVSSDHPGGQRPPPQACLA